ISLAVRVRCSQGFKDTNTVAPLDLNARFRMLIPDIAVTYLISGKVLCRSASISLSTSLVRAEEEPSGSVIPAKNAPPSSEGIKPFGLVVNIKPLQLKLIKGLFIPGVPFLLICLPLFNNLTFLFSTIPWNFKRTYSILLRPHGQLLVSV